jgi:hypothetical protein
MNSKILGLLGFSMAAMPAFVSAQTPQLKPNPILVNTLAGHPAPVVLELFTSQGCSSCPPAEALLNTWGQDQFKNGKIIPLAFHVDYWDYLGWKDPFSSPEYTGRQKAYAPVLGMDSLYTPQAVLGGQADAVGSDSSAVQKRIAALAGHLADTGLEVKALRTRNQLEIKTTAAAADKAGSDWVLNVAVFENNLTTQAARGENGGRTLNENFVVRSFSRIYPVKSAQSLTIAWDPAWKARNLGVAVYLQDRRSLFIDSSAALFPVP